MPLLLGAKVQWVQSPPTQQGVKGIGQSDTSCCHVTPPSVRPSGASWVREEALPDEESVTQQVRRSLACCDVGDVSKQQEETALDYPAATTLNQLATVSSGVQHSAAGSEGGCQTRH